MPVNLYTGRENAQIKSFGSSTPAGSAYQYAPDIARAAGMAAAAKAPLQTDTFTSNVKMQLPFLALFEGVPFLRFLYQNHKLGGKMTSELAALGNASNTALKNVFSGTEGSFFARLGSYFKAANDNKNALSSLNRITSAKRAVQTAEKAGKTLSESVLKKSAEKIIPSAGQGGFKGLLKSSGAKTMLMFSGALETLFEIIPAFRNLGFKQGVKQTVKSAVKVSSETAGFIAGDCIGTAAGTAIGTALCPGIGTLIGAAAGFIAGSLGSIYAGKLAKKITGKSENEKAKEQQTQKLQAELLKQAEKEYKEQLGNNPFYMSG